MREWNAGGGTPRVHFVGFDMQFPGAAIDSVTAFVARAEPAQASAVHDAYECLAPYRNPPSSGLTRSSDYSALHVTVQDACRASVASVESLFVARTSAWASVEGAARTALAQRLARIISQWEASVRPQTGTWVRDAAMAENAAWWLSSAPGGSRMMLWAHNGHISRQRRWMGWHLGGSLGADYVNAALTFSSGTFTAVTLLSGGASAGLSEYYIGGSEVGSIEETMSATGYSRLILDARSLDRDGAPVGLRRLVMRSIGCCFNPTASTSVYATTVLLPQDFDIVIWFGTTTASRLLPLGASANIRPSATLMPP
jgi:erythromycin esterase